MRQISKILEKTKKNIAFLQLIRDRLCPDKKTVVMIWLAKLVNAFLWLTAAILASLLMTLFMPFILVFDQLQTDLD